MSLVALVVWGGLGGAIDTFGQTNYRDNETLYSNQDPNTETRRSDHFRICFGHFSRDTGTPMTEQLAQGNLQMFEQMWHRWVVELGLHDINESVTRPDGHKYRANFNVLMTWNDGGGGGAYSSMDGNGFFYAMANSGYCRFDPPSGATPHEFGHVWEGSCAGFNGSDSSGAWWECTANWMQLQFLNSYPQAGGYLANAMYYPCHGRDYYDAFMIWEAAKEDPRYGAGWVNTIWTNANATQRTSEFILDRMIRCDSSGSPDKAGALKDLWGDMAKKMITWDFQRQRWLAQANKPDDGSDWYFYQRNRTPLVKMPGTSGWYCPARSHAPMEFGFNFIPLTATPGATVTCDFQPDCDPVRQSDWRACLVAVSTNNDARYSILWNKGAQSLKLAADETKLYLVVIATPKPMKIAEPAWKAYLTDAGRQFPYRVAFIGAAPRNVIYPAQSRANMRQHANGGGWVANTATVDATAYVGPNAQVLNTAQVRNSARIEDWAVVRNSAQVRDHAVVSGHAMVQDNAKVYGHAKVRDWARVFGYAEVYENAKVIEHANCGDGNATTHTKVYGNAVVKGTTYVYDTSTFAGGIIVDGDTANGNGTTAATYGVHFGWSWGADAARFTGLTNNHFIYAQHAFEQDNAVFALDQYGINHGFLMSGCRVEKDTNAPTRGGRVLPLDGVSQYVELHNSVNDFKDTAIAVWMKWAGGAADQRIWSLGDGASKVMYLTPNDSTAGGLRLIATDGVATESLNGGALAANTWTHVAVVFSGTASNATLYVNGAPVATNNAVTLFPDSLNAPLMENANYLGRGRAGNYFPGCLDDFRVYMKSLSAAEVAAIYSAAAPAPVTITADTAAPTPNAATWLVSPVAVSDSAVTMSATPGTDASGWVEYYFACTAGGGHNSGWVSFNKYTDVGLTPGAAYTYTVRMRDRAGNVTTASAPVNASTPMSTVGAASFAYGPVGISSSAISMTATKGTNASGHTEYLFSRSGRSSGWQASPTWTDTGLSSGGTYTYTVQMRDRWGNLGAASAGVTAVARDQAAPLPPRSYAQWSMRPYATIDNKVSMTAQTPTTSDASGVQYFFRCASSNAPDSGWQDSATYLTPALPDGTYTFEYKVRDKGASNESPASVSYGATITPTTGYHPYTLSQVLTNQDDCLVNFTATVMKVNANNYLVKDLASGAAITVRPSTSNQVTDASFALKNVTVKGHLYTFGGERVVTFATLTTVGNPETRTISGKVISTTGTAVAGAIVYFSDCPNAAANPIITAITDASGNYSRAVTPGTWYVVAAASAYNTAVERTVVVTNANVSSINFSLVANALITGEVTRQSDGRVLAGAAVYFSQSPGASGSPVFTATADASGRYRQPVQDGVWFVCAGAAGHFTSADKMVTVDGALVTNINFALKSNARNIPATNRLLFSAVTDSLPETGNTGPWAQYLPPGGGAFATVGGNPTVAKIDGAKWVRNYRVGTSTGFRVLGPTTAIPCNGVTIVTAARPLYVNPGGEQRGELVDIMYDRLALAVAHTDGRIMVARNGNWGTYGPAIPQDRTTILSLVVQPDGSYRVYTNGVQAMTGAASTPNFATQLVPTGSQTFKQYVNLGRNDPDGWSAYEGYLGDVFVYTNALSTAERQQLEADFFAKFLNSGYAISVSAGAGGYVNPGGTVTVPPGGSQSFVITPRSGYEIAEVRVDGVARGALGSVTFTNVTAPHTLAATFAASVMAPRIFAFEPRGSGAFQFQVTNAPATNFTLLVSTNLDAWFPLSGALRYSNGVFHLEDPTALQQHQRFYRLQYP